MACLHKARLADITQSASFLWVGWNKQVGGFVYVQLYQSLKLAKTQAEFLKAEESGISDRLVISQHITPYSGSPVPTIVKCLRGKMISKAPRKTKPFTF